MSLYTSLIMFRTSGNGDLIPDIIPENLLKANIKYNIVFKADMNIDILLQTAWASSSCKERKRELQNETFLRTAGFELTTLGFRSL